MRLTLTKCLGHSHHQHVCSEQDKTKNKTMTYTLKSTKKWLKKLKLYYMEDPSLFRHYKMRLSVPLEGRYHKILAAENFEAC